MFHDEKSIALLASLTSLTIKFGSCSACEEKAVQVLA